MAREKAAVVALDAALNDWLNNLPNHLRWKPPAGDPIALIQSAAVLCSYYAAQVSPAPHFRGSNLMRSRFWYIVVSSRQNVKGLLAFPLLVRYDLVICGQPADI